MVFSAASHDVLIIHGLRDTKSGYGYELFRPLPGLKQVFAKSRIV